ncbi:MAG: LysR family transcriptional regulator [Sphingorhabdus sp.]
MDRLTALSTFVTVADNASFAEAARSTGQSAVAVTRHIAQLEAHFGTRLFHRSTRSVSLTDAGSTLLDHARQIVVAADEADAALRGVYTRPQGQLFVTAPTAFGRLHVLPVIQSMLLNYPELSVRLMLVDRNVRIVEEGIDVAVRIGHLVDSALKSVRIGSVVAKIVASPSYVARKGTPSSPADLADHDLIVTSGSRASTEWRFGNKVVPIKPRLMVTTVDSAISAVEAGVGIANLLSYQVEQPLDEGRMIALLQSHPVDPLPVSLLFAERRTSSAATRAFIERMVAGSRMGLNP